MNDHLAMIKEQNDHIAKLNAKIAEHELENEKKLNLLIGQGSHGSRWGRLHFIP
jgi:hypothetical protein